MGQNAAIKKGFKLVLDELRKASAGRRLDLSKEAGRMLVHEAIQSCMFGAVALGRDVGREIGVSNGLFLQLVG